MLQMSYISSKFPNYKTADGQMHSQSNSCENFLPNNKSFWYQVTYKSLTPPNKYRSAICGTGQFIFNHLINDDSFVYDNWEIRLTWLTAMAFFSAFNIILIQFHITFFFLFFFLFLFPKHALTIRVKFVGPPLFFCSVHLFTALKFSFLCRLWDRIVIPNPFENEIPPSHPLSQCCV